MARLGGVPQNHVLNAKPPPDITRFLRRKRRPFARAAWCRIDGYYRPRGNRGGSRRQRHASPGQLGEKITTAALQLERLPLWRYCVSDRAQPWSWAAYERSTGFEGPSLKRRPSPLS